MGLDKLDMKWIFFNQPFIFVATSTINWMWEFCDSSKKFAQRNPKFDNKVILENFDHQKWKIKIIQFKAK